MSPGSAPPVGSVPLPGLVTHNGGVSVTVSNGRGTAVYSPDHEHSPPAPVINHHSQQRPISLKTASGKSGTGSAGKRTRWLLCYHMGGGAPSASPSPPSEQGNSQCSTPSPTDHGFKLPNSFSNERPTSLPVALLNCGGGNTDGNSIVTLGRGVVGESRSVWSPLYACSILSWVAFH